MRRHGEEAAWPAVLSSVLLSGAALRYGMGPSTGSVRLGEMTAVYAARAVVEGGTAEDVRAWALDTALDRVARRRGAALLPAGAPDVTAEVEAALAAILARTEGIAAPPGDGR